MGKLRSFTFFWLTGQREVFKGTTPADALNKAGYGHGALGALDFFADGDDDSYSWNAEQHTWRKNE